MSIRLRKNYIKDNDENKELSKNEINELNDSEFNKNPVSNLYFEKIYCCISYSCNFIYKTIKFIINFSGIYLLWICLHYFSSYLYIKLCVPNTLVGLFLSPFLTSTPHCQGLRWIIYNGANIINNMWLIIGTWLCAKLLIFTKNNHTE